MPRNEIALVGNTGTPIYQISMDGSYQERLLGHGGSFFIEFTDANHIANKRELTT